MLLHAAGLEPEPALELALQLAHAQRLVVLLVEHELDLRLDLRARRHGKIALREERRARHREASSQRDAQQAFDLPLARLQCRDQLGRRGDGARVRRTGGR